MRAWMHFWQYFSICVSVKPDVVGGYIFKSSANLKMTHRSLKDYFIGSLKKSAYEINGLAITNVSSKLSNSRKRNYLQMIQRYFANEL